MKAAVEESERNGVEVLETKKILRVAETAYNRGDYVLAYERLQEAQLTYALETKGEFSIYHLVKNNPLESAGILAAVALLSLGSTAAIRLRLYKRKIKMLNEEEKLLLQLMAVVQGEAFEKNTMSMTEYQTAMTQYEDRLSKAIEDRIKAQTKISNMLKIRGKKKALNEEKARLTDLVKDIQDRYLNKGTLETRVYENMLKTYTTRLSEVDEEIAFLEANKAIKKKTALLDSRKGRVLLRKKK